MNLLKRISRARGTVLIILLALLMVTAGCSSELPGDIGGGTPAEERGAAKNQFTPTNGTDLRSISIPENGTAIKQGELDGSDPRNKNWVYEPIEFAATTGTHVTIAMESDSGEPEVRLRSPSGSIVDIASNGEDGVAGFDTLTLSETGRYTIEATSASPNTTFGYTLYVEEDTELFAGPMSSWSEQERYLEFASDTALNANSVMDSGETYNTSSPNADVSPLIDVNTSADYAVISYQMRTDLNSTEFVYLDWALLNGFSYTVEDYENSETVDDAWIPERVYFRGVTYDGELYRTNYVNTAWAREYIRTQETSDYWWRFVSTRVKGPAHSTYEPGGNYSTTDSEFPLGTYENFTVEENTPQS